MAEAHKAQRRLGKNSRCAIYTRKSTEEGLDQDFNSLDAQREACAAFIQSQKHEGWTELQARYDDGGYSGGTIERPALQQLLTDIEAGRIDVVVVYKVDRLTRSLSDFAKLVDVFARRDVSFVSITQQFNTTTSMGRLTLNILLSFAQFERELIGERVRDKFAASKKKGMWMGGTVPLGYDVKERKLVVNDIEARVVVDVYRRYLRLKSVPALAEELAAAGIRSKRRRHPDGTEYGNQRFSRGTLYLMLQNRTYRGEATHKGNAYPGEHSAIVDKPLWDAVQALLADNRVTRVSGANTKQPSLLTGMIFDEAGERLTPSWSAKKGTRYRYYVSKTPLIGPGQTRSPRRRFPAGNLESVVIDRLHSFFTNPGELLDAIGELDERSGRRQLIEGAKTIASELEDHQLETMKTIMKALVHRVQIMPDCIKIHIFRRRLAKFIAAPVVDPTVGQQNGVKAPDHVLTLLAPAQLKRAGREMKMLVDDSGDCASIDMGLLRIVARAHGVQARLAQNTTLTVHDIARDERVTAAYVYALLRLPWLAPDITTAIVNGRQPPELNAKKLMRLTGHLPADWTEQRALLGFR